MQAIASQSHHPAPLAARALPTWRLWVYEGSLLGLSLLAACAVGVLLGHPRSPVRMAIESPLARRGLMALAGGVIAVCAVYSPWGRRSGPMLNPAMTLTFWRLGRLSGRDAAGFIAGQFAGAMAGLGMAALLLGQSARDIRFAAHLPGRYGLAAAWTAEFTIALLLACMVFTVNRTRWVKLSGLFAAALLAVCVVVASPVSGTGVNAARTFASSVFAHVWTGWWIYFTAPPLGFLAAVELMRAVGRPPGSLCGKMTHHPSCHFRCYCVTVAGRRVES